MKFFLLTIALACSQAAAFTNTDTMKSSRRTQLFAEYTPLEGEGKINLKVDLDSPKVATMVRMLYCYLKSYDVNKMPKYSFLFVAHFPHHVSPRRST
jgi:hypothetical protein